MPRPEDINTAGMNISAKDLGDLTAVPKEAWRRELTDLRSYLHSFGGRLPAKLVAELDEVAARIDAS